MLLELNNIQKSFGNTKALRGVNLQVQKAEIHALIGENGAGKSTLMKILSGAITADAGTMTFNEKPYQPHAPLDARKAGIVMIYQELTLATHLTVEENITLGLEKNRFGFVQNQAQAVKNALTLLGQQDIDPKTPINQLSLGKQQLVEIARALVSDTQLVIMDEPTSSLSAADTEALFAVIQKLKEQGISVIYVSHFLEEVQQVCDSFTVLRDGETIASGDMKKITIPEIIRAMVGRSVDELYPENTHTIGETILEVVDLKGFKLPENVSFKLRKGEILGISGLIGAGRSETVRSVFGLNQTENGMVSIRNQPSIKAYYLNPAKALQKGINLLSENRKEEGLALNLSIGANLTFSNLKKYVDFGFLNLKKENESINLWADKLQVKRGSVTQKIGLLSGGNQQKVCIARLLHHGSEVLFLDEPTRGIDVGSKAEIYKIIHELATQGKAIVMISSYLPELLGVCDTLAVMYRGKLSEVKPVADWQAQAVMLYATSGNLTENT
ncbi:MAG: sugar ABC transporter ATP-binding protein [Verrucomicrobia bacterium]|nr:sugar ABC transporter ATP-binding protein [Cytophagales bacterium]